MTVSVVNGFLCYSSCDEAKARAGKDPHPRAAPASMQPQDGAGEIDAQQAVVFGGALAGLNAVTPTDASQAAAGAALTPQQTVNVLA